jgi:hypothetical protein
VADDQAVNRHALDRPLHGKAVEAEATNPALVVARGKQIRGGDVGDRAVKGGVEDGDVLRLRQPGAGFLDRGDRRRIVQRCELDERFELGGNGVVDRRGLDELRSTMDDTVADRAHGRRLLERCERVRAVIAVDDREPEACRPGVDDQDVVQRGHVQPAIAGSSSP